MSDPKRTGDPSTSKIGEAEKASDEIQPGSEKAPEKPEGSPTPFENPKPEEPIPEVATKSEPEKFVDLASVKAAVDDALEGLPGLKTIGVSSKKAGSPDDKGPDPAVEPVESGRSLCPESGKTVPEVCSTRDPRRRGTESGVLGQETAGPTHLDVGAVGSPLSPESQKLRVLCKKFLIWQKKHKYYLEWMEETMKSDYEKKDSFLCRFDFYCDRIHKLPTFIPDNRVVLDEELDKLTYTLRLARDIHISLIYALEPILEHVSTFTQKVEKNNKELVDLMDQIISSLCSVEPHELSGGRRPFEGQSVSDRNTAISKPKKSLTMTKSKSL